LKSIFTDRRSTTKNMAKYKNLDGHEYGGAEKLIAISGAIFNEQQITMLPRLSH